MTDFRLAPVYYPGTHLRRASLSRLAYIFGSFRLLQPPGLTPPREGFLAGVAEPVTLELPPERARRLEAVLADYQRWAAANRGTSYAVYLHQRRQASEETLREVTRALKGAPPGPSARPAPEDLGWQILLRLAHDYDRQQEEIDAIMERVRSQERQLAGLTGLELDELDTGPPDYERVEEGEARGLPEELTTPGRLAAFGRLWLATGCEGTPLSESEAAHDYVLAAAEPTGPEEPVEFALELPDAGRLTLEEARARRAAASGALEGVLARLATLQALLRAREWSEEVRASVDLLALETREAADRVCREPEAPAPRLRLRCAAVPNLDPQRLFARLSGQGEPEEAASGLYLLAAEIS